MKGKPRILHWGQDRRAENRGQRPRVGMGLGERCELPSGVRGRAATAQRFSTVFST